MGSDIPEPEREELIKELDRQKQLALDAARLGWWRYDPEKKHAWYDKRYTEIFGVSGSERANDEILKLIHPDDMSRVWAAVEAALDPADPKPYAIEYRVNRPDGEMRWVGAHGIAEFKGNGADRHAVNFVGTVEDITGSKRTEKERETTLRILNMIQSCDSTRDLIREVTAELQKWSGCEAVGIRLRDGDDFPYYETRGFPKEFVEAENSLCARGHDRKPLLDPDGWPVLDCMCGNVLSGRFDPAMSFFTNRGSFWSNCTTKLLATTTDADRQARTRNRCNGEGYESVALIRLRTGNETFGLMQFNDHKENRFTPETLFFLERTADQIAIALDQRRYRNTLEKNEKRLSALFDNMMNGLAYCRMIYEQDKPVDFIYLAVNHAFETQTGLKDVVGKKVTELIPGIRESDPWVFDVYGRVARTGIPESLERYVSSLDMWFQVSVYCPQKDHFVAVFDVVTERMKAEEEIRWSARRNELLSNTAAKLLETEDPQGLVNELCNRIMEFLDCQAFFNFLNDKASGKLHLNAYAGLPDEKAKAIEWLDYGVAICGCAALENCRIIAEDIQNTPDPMTELVKSYGIQAYCCHPLVIEGEIFGTLSFGTNNRPRFADREVAVMKEISDMVAVAMRRIHDRDALTAREAEFAAVFDNSPVATIVVNRDRQVVKTNFAAADFAGKSPEEMNGTHGGEALGCFHASDIPEGCGYGPHCATCTTRLIVLDTLQNGRSHIRVEAPLVLKRGKKQQDLDILISTSPIGPPENRMAVVCIEDITKQKHTEEQREQFARQLMESNSTIRALLNATNDIVLLTEQDGTIMIANRVLSDRFNKPLEQLIGKTIYELIDPETGAGRRACIEKVIATGNPIRSEDERDGTHFDNIYYPVKDENETVKQIAIFARDITERKNMEKEREKLQHQLLQSQKMEAVGRLAGGVAHDFNNMLSVIIGNSELALMMLDDNSPFRVEIQEILSAATRSADLTRQLLAFARKQTVKPETLDLNDTVSGMLKMLQRLIGEDIDLVWKPGRDLWKVQFDPSQVDQVLANLMVNARDAIKGVGKITIETGKVVFDEEYCSEHMEFVPGSYTMLGVSDDGCGMDGETLRLIFEPFFTTKGKGEGTGLGLSTVYGIVRQNNGFINVYSEPGEGTTFKIYLPRFTGEEIETTANVEKLPPATGTETVLIVEDEKSILKLGKRFLDSLGYLVLATENPNEAIRMAGEYAGEIHLLVTDVVMPEMNGRELAERLRSTRPGLKCLYMSGYTANVIAHHGVLEDGIIFMQKPFSINELATKIRVALGQQG